MADLFSKTGTEAIEKASQILHDGRPVFLNQ
jgi:hypothetical protein